MLTLQNTTPQERVFFDLAYYNEFDGYAASWLENLIRKGHIAYGVVDRRDIRDVEPADLDGFTQCHFFAGIGVWSYALRRAGWSDERRVWTGSCPCQPFSAAGKGEGFADERHLWPALHWLIEQCRPDIVLGEQVASKDGLSWIDLVLSDLEDSHYAGGAVDLCAAGVGAPHIRQRMYWMAHAMRSGWTERRSRAGPGSLAGRSSSSRLADANNKGLEGRPGVPERARERIAGANGMVVGLADTARSGRPTRLGHIGKARDELHNEGCIQISGERPGPANGFWRDADWLGCTDGKWRPVEPGTFPLANGVANRVGQLRAYGNALNAEQATVFIEACMGCLDV